MSTWRDNVTEALPNNEIDTTNKSWRAIVTEKLFGEQPVTTKSFTLKTSDEDFILKVEYPETVTTWKELTEINTAFKVRNTNIDFMVNLSTVQNNSTNVLTTDEIIEGNQYTWNY